MCAVSPMRISCGHELTLPLADDGSMDAKAREAALQTIKKISNVHVILISFKAGSTGRLDFF